MVTAYVLNQCPPRPLKRLYDRREELYDKLRTDYLAAKDKPVEKVATNGEVATYPCGTPIRQ